MKIKDKKLKPIHEMSTFMLKCIVDKWSENEVIMNLRDRIKNVELENGKLKSEISELMDQIESNKTIKKQKIKENTIFQLEKKLKKYKDEENYWKDRYFNLIAKNNKI